MLIDLDLHGRDRDRLVLTAKARGLSVNALATALLRAALSAPGAASEAETPVATGRVRFEAVPR